MTVSISAPRASSSADSSAPLFVMPIALDAVGEPIFVRDDGDNPADPADGGTASVSIVDVVAAPGLEAKALRLAVTAGRGGWAVPVDLGAVVLPEAGFVLEVEFSGIDAYAIGGSVLPLAAVVGDTIEGIAAPFFSGVMNMTGQVRVVSSDYARVANLTASATSWSNSPSETRCARGPHVQRLTVRRTSGTTPLAWTMTSETQSPEGSVVHSAAWSGAVDAIASFNGRTFDQIALLVWVPGGLGPVDAFLDVQALRVLPLP